MTIDLNPLTSASSGLALNEPAPKSRTKLEEAATQFEAMMIAQMMKSARESSGGGWLSDGNETGEDTSAGMAEEQFAQAMARSGGLGLAKMVIKTMSASENKTPPVPAGSLRGRAI
jgi:flagellar protein FlgJ